MKPNMCVSPHTAHSALDHIWTRSGGTLTLHTVHWTTSGPGVVGPSHCRQLHSLSGLDADCVRRTPGDDVGWTDPIPDLWTPGLELGILRAWSMSRQGVCLLRT